MTSLPKLEREYEFVTNWLHSSTGNAYTDRRYLLLKVHDVLTGYSNSPWTAVATSNNSSAGWPGPGWNSVSDVVQYSWVVLENVSGVQVCLYMKYQYAVDIYFSPDGSFSGGSTGANPPLTSANYRTTNDSYCFWAGTTSQNVRLNFIHAIDGTFDIFFSVLTANQFAHWSPVLAAKFEETSEGWNLPWAAFSDDQASADDWPDSNIGWGWQEGLYWRAFKDTGGDTPFDGMLSGEVVSSDRPNQAWLVANEISGAWQMFPLQFVSGTAGAYGFHGRLPDVYAVSEALTTGTFLETDIANPSYKWIVFGDYVFPWNGSPVILTV